jgi:hypothetical protein
VVIWFLTPFVPPFVPCVWLRATELIMTQALTPLACRRLCTFPEIDRDNFELTVASLRALASDLKLEDLRRS